MSRWLPIPARAGKAVLLMAGLALAAVALRWSGLSVELAGRAGPGHFLLIASLACAVGVPRQLAAYAGGVAFGAWQGALLALAAEVLACAANFAWARLVARGWAKRLLARRPVGRLSRANGFLLSRPFGATLVLRLLPVGSNILLNLLAGVSGVAVLPFLFASALGYVPQTVVFALLGSGAQLGQNVHLLLGIGLFVLSILLGWTLLRRHATSF